MNVHFAGALDILNHNLEACKIQGRDSIEANIKHNQSPFKESINGICWQQLAAEIPKSNGQI